MQPIQEDDTGVTVALIIAAVLIIISMLLMAAMKYELFKNKRKDGK